MPGVDAIVWIRGGDNFALVLALRGGEGWNASSKGRDEDEDADL
jgi:hypothetical protein